MLDEQYRNPYDFTNPIKDPRFFAGRHKELEEIDYYLELSKSKEPKYIHLALVGPRSVGKTSLLNMIEHKADGKGFLVVKIPLNEELVKNDVLFFKEVIDGIMTKGAEKGMFGGISGKIYKAFRRRIDALDIQAEIPLLFGTVYIGMKKGVSEAGIPQHVLLYDLKQLREEAKKQGIPTIVLLFDECDLFAKNAIILQKMRNIFTELDGYILVFSGTDKMFSVIGDVFSPIPRFFKRINVENFKFEEVEEALLKPLNDEEKAAFDKSCIVDIYRITNGSPYEINLIAHYMYRRWKEGKSPKIQLSPEVLDDVLDELERLREGGHYEIANKIKRCWTSYLKVLISLLEFPRVPKDWLVEYILLDEVETTRFKDVHAKRFVSQEYIEYLKKDGLICEEDGKLFFKGDSFDILYLKYLCASRGLIDAREFFIGFPNDPLLNLHRKLVEKTLLKDFPEYHIHTAFDKREKFDGKTGRKFIIGGKVTLPPGEHTILEISPETRREFYLGSPNSIRFRVNIKWMNEGFVTQVKFKKDDDLERFVKRLETLKDKLEFLGYQILLKDEISWNLEGAKYLERRNFEEAMKCFEKAIEINPLFELPWANKARVLFSLKKYDEALDCINKALELHPNWVEALTLKGMILINKGLNQEALECLEKATKIDPENWSAWDNKGRALFNLRRYEEAAECFDKALKFNLTNCEILYLKGLSLFNLRKYEEAMDCLNKALELNPNFTQALTLALFIKAIISFKKADYEDALNSVDRILEIERNNIEALILKSVILSKLSRDKEAIECCDEILKIDPNNGAALYNKACFMAKLGDKENALKCLEKAIEIDEKFIEIARKDESLLHLKDEKRFQELIKKNDLASNRCHRNKINGENSISYIYELL
jgi:tetratricopeptide (TPR) repeat protein